MERKIFSERLFDALASLRLAVITMSTLAVTCTAATFYEMRHGTEAAQRDVYRTWWFALILVTLGANIFCAMMKRYPWKSQHTGFVIAHIGIITLLVGSLISLHFGLDSNMALYEGETSDRVALLEKAVQVVLPGHAAHGSFPVVFEKDPPGPGRERRFPVPGTEVAVVAEDFLPHVQVAERVVEGGGENPALHFHLQAPMAQQDGWLMAREPGKNHLHLGPVSLAYDEAESEKAAREHLGHSDEKSHISFVRLPDGRVLYALSTADGPGAQGVVEVGRPIQTPWMGMTVTIDRALANAALERDVQPATPPEKDERRMPAVRLRLEGPQGRTPSDWVLWTESRAVRFGNEAATLAYRSPELQVPFKVTLLKFNSDKYPGSNMAATYESWVRVEDPERGSSEHHISMNHPLHYRGYIFFQASFVEGQPMMSIFSVARAPGLPLVYLGVTLIGVGVAWMFYVKPYLARRQAQRALAARRLQENPNEAVPADPVAPPAAAEPASGRA